jgi:uncharacterized protein YkwD
VILAMLLAASLTSFGQQSRGVLSETNRAHPGDSSKTADASRKSIGKNPDSHAIDERRLREIETLEQQCLDEVNRLRQANGLRPFGFDRELLPVARDYSRRMAEEKFFSHVDPEGKTVKQRIERASIRWRMVGENLAYSNGFINPVAASLHSWMESPGHRDNILDPDFELSAVGVWISANGTVYFTEIFLKK